MNDNLNSKNTFDKLFIIIFLLFLFAFLSYASYDCIQNNNYTFLIFICPFWVIGIYIACKHLFGIKFKINPLAELNLIGIIAKLLLVCGFVSGIILLSMGIHNTYEMTKKTKDYLITDGYFKNYKVYNVDRDGTTTYQLTYDYKIDNKNYTISTDYGVGIKSIPEVGTKKSVKYNPNNPNEALLVGTNSNSLLIYFGAFFIIVVFGIVIGILYMRGNFNKFRVDILKLCTGIILTVTGIGVISLQYRESFSILATIKSLGIFIIIPIMFILVGIGLTINSIFFKKKN